MPVTPTYPGVYIEEVPSGVRTIVGVATSITAFIGRALRGPTDTPVRIQSFADFERAFGGLWIRSTMSYAVQQYFQNGGTDAIIVRVANPGANAIITIPGPSGPLLLEVLEKGAAGNNLQATVAAGIDFNLTITDTATGTSTSGDVTLANLANGVAAVSSLVRAIEPFPGVAPTAGTATAVGGVDDARQATMTISDTLTLEAVVVGTGGNDLQATVTHGTGDLFTLTVTDTNTAETGTLTDTDMASLADDIAADPVLSTLVRIRGALPNRRPDEVTNVAATGGSADERATLVLPRAGTDLGLVAANAGAWGNSLEANVDLDTRDPGDAQLFNLTVEDSASGAVETFRNVSVDEDSPRLVTRILEQESVFVRINGALPALAPSGASSPFDASGGADGAAITDAEIVGSESEQEGIFALETADLFNLLCIPPLTREVDVNPTVTYGAALAYCKRRRAMLIVDPPSSWNNVTQAEGGVDGLGLRDENSAIFFPRIRVPDPLKENRLEEFVPCGVVAGIMARTDAQRGVWKAPAGLDATLSGVRELSVKLTDGENGRLNPLAVNCLRNFAVVGNVLWGARTMEGADRLGSEWKYIPVRRIALFIEESLYRGTQFAVFEPNDEPLWSQLRLNIGAFMQNLFRQGAFQGRSPKEAYLVKCDKETTTQNDINLGIVNILVGFAPLKPAEFVIIKIQQLAGQIQA